MRRKPKMTAEALVQKMRDEKGITFDYKSEQEAIDYLKNINNYFRTASYRKNFEKYKEGPNKGKYIRLDFGCLTELSTLDMYYRYLMYKMCIDIEHALKVYIVNYFESQTQLDEYQIVKNFLNKPSNNYIKKNISRYHQETSYMNGLTDKYFAFDNNNELVKWSHCPVWVFIEVLTFGDFLKFYFYCQEQEAAPLHKFVLLKDNNILNLIRNLRNACAHNNCTFENLSTGTTNPPAKISQFVAKMDIGSNSRRKKLTVRPILEFVSLLLVFDEIVSVNIKQHRYKELKDLFENRMLKNIDIMKNNDLLRSNYNFVKKIIQSVIYS